MVPGHADKKLIGHAHGVDVSEAERPRPAGSANRSARFDADDGDGSHRFGTPLRGLRAGFVLRLPVPVTSVNKSRRSGVASTRRSVVMRLGTATVDHTFAPH